MSGPQRYVLSGCSGGGKSTLLAELGRRGFSAFEEPGRQIVREAQEKGGDELPWVHPEAFAEKAIEMSVTAFDEASKLKGPVFYDRSFVDATSYIAHLKGELTPGHEHLLNTRRYALTVFLVPPWPEIFKNDEERQVSFASAVGEYERLQVSFVEFGYQIAILPKASVAERVAFLLANIEE